MSADKKPPLPTMHWQHAGYWFTDEQMHAYARAYAAEQTRELVEALGSTDRLLQIEWRQAQLVNLRAARDVAGCGTFGIAVKSDSEAREWQALDKERSELLCRIRALIAEHKENGK